MLADTEEAMTPFQQMMATGAAPTGPSLLELMVRDIWPLAVLHVCLLLFLLAATGVPSHFFHPEDVPVHLQNRAIAMSYYTCGSLACGHPMVPFVVPAVYLALQIWGLQAAEVQVGAGLAVVAGIVGSAWLYDMIQLARRTMPQVQGRPAAIAFALPMLWLAEGALILIGLPLLIFALAVVPASLG